MMILLGPKESLDILLRSGELPPSMPPSKQRRIITDQRLLPVPSIVGASVQDRVLATPPKLDDSTVASLPGLGVCADTYTALVGDQRLRRYPNRLHSIPCSAKLPPQSLLQASENTFVLAPELCLVFLARSKMISDIELAFDASELCSRYAYENVPHSERNYIERMPFTSADRIQAFCSKLNSLNSRALIGSSRVRKILPLVIENARSAQEIELAMNLKAPRHRRGAGISDIELNKRIELLDKEKHLLKKSYIEIDIFCPSILLAIEYQGYQHNETVNQDEMRRNILLRKGFTVETVSSGILDAGPNFEIFLQRVTRAMGIKLKSDADSIMQRMDFQRQTKRLASRHGTIVKGY